MWPKNLSRHPIFPNPKIYDGTVPIAYGGSLEPDTLINAYSFGIFPWYNEDEPIIWWCPTPRYIIYPSDIHVAKSMRPYLNGKYRITIDQGFVEVIRNCKTIDRDGQGTWINDDMAIAYIELAKRGVAHSVEVWEDEVLVGGLYGVSIGKIFSGESMFARKSNASKFALISLAKLLEEHDFYFIDCQIENAHLSSMGGRYIDKDIFYELLQKNRRCETLIDPLWTK